MNKDRIGICIIGSGRAGLIHARNLARGVDHAHLVAVTDSLEEAAARAGRGLGVPHFTDYRETLKDREVDAVVVATPTAYHRDITLAAAAAGKHVFCEKPMAMNVQECREMIRATEENGVKLQIGFMRRFDQSFLFAKERVRQGEIGEVVLVKSLTRGPSAPRRWQYDLDKSNGPLAEVNSHDIDTLRWFTESEFKEVFALAGNYRCPEAVPEYPDFYDNVILNARFQTGALGYIDGAVSVKYGYDARVEILGTEGVLFVGRIEQGSVVSCSKGRGIVRPFTKSWRDLFQEAYRAEDRSFVECLREDKTPRVTGLDGMRAVEVVTAGNRSIKEKRIVYLDQREVGC